MATPDAAPRISGAVPDVGDGRIGRGSARPVRALRHEVRGAECGLAPTKTARRVSAGPSAEGGGCEARPRCPRAIPVADRAPLGREDGVKPPSSRFGDRRRSPPRRADLAARERCLPKRAQRSRCRRPRRRAPAKPPIDARPGARGDRTKIDPPSVCTRRRTSRSLPSRSLWSFASVREDFSEKLLSTCNLAPLLHCNKREKPEARRS